LLCSKYFLLVFIRTLEARQNDFSAQDKYVTTSSSGGGGGGGADADYEMQLYRFIC